MFRFAALSASLCCLIAAVVAGPASGAVERNDRFTYTASVIACGGEQVTVEVTVHLLSRVTYDAQGVAHLGSTVTTFFRGTSADGDRYIGPSHQTNQLLGEVASEIVQTSTFNQNLIRLGEDGTEDDLRGRAIFHFTWNAQGELVASKFEFVIECS
jgi:hypothetical protein